MTCETHPIRATARKLATVLFAITTIALSGCSTRAKHFAEIDSSAVEASRTAAEKAVADATGAHNRSKAAVEKVAVEHAQSVQITGTITAKLAALFRISPPELRDAITSIKSDVLAQTALQNRMSDDLGAAQIQLTNEGDALKVATANQLQLRADLASYKTKADSQTDQLNATESARAETAKTLLWYQLHFWMGIVILVAGVALCGVLAFLKFTGRIALKIPNI